SNVTAPGEVTVEPRDPQSAGQQPSGYQTDSNSMAFDVETKATATGPFDVDYAVPPTQGPIANSSSGTTVTTSSAAQTRLLHVEQGVLVDRTTSIDLVTNTIHAQSDSLGTFLVATAPNLQFQFRATSYSVSEGAGFATITVSRLGDVSGAGTVSFATSNGTAKEGRDYTAGYGVLNFAAGETNKNFNVLTIDNAFVDGARTVNLALSNPSGA